MKYFVLKFASSGTSGIESKMGHHIFFSEMAVKQALFWFQESMPIPKSEKGTANFTQSDWNLSEYLSSMNFPHKTKKKSSVQ